VTSLKDGGDTSNGPAPIALKQHEIADMTNLLSQKCYRSHSYGLLEG